MRDVFGMLFGGWSELLRILLVGTVAYIGTLLFIRTAGKRALSKLSAYDFIVTVALGSTLATAILSSQVTVDRALLGVGLLLALQRLAAWASMRSPTVRRVLNNDPALVVYRGRMLEDAMRREHLSADDVQSAVRKAGKSNVDEVEAVVLETDGSLSVIAQVEGALPAPLGSRQSDLRSDAKE